MVEPEIPANTANVARTCAATGARLHLVKPLGFSVDDKHLKRAGLDYWESVDIHKVESMEEMYSQFPNGTFYYLTTKTDKLYTDIQFKDGDFIVFGPETRGLPEKYVKSEFARTIPMKEGQRSLNLSNSVAIVAYEAIRQNGL